MQIYSICAQLGEPYNVQILFLCCDLTWSEIIFLAIHQIIWQCMLLFFPYLSDNFLSSGNSSHLNWI